MKNKSARHKDTNTFKFQPFSERIANIDIDIFHHVAHEYESQFDDEEECFFHKTVFKWDVLNLTEGYHAFRKELGPQNVITLPQLIHNKDHVVQTLIKYLQKKDLLFLQPLLELTVALVKDLSKEFYDYYSQFFELIIDLLNTKNTDQLEWTFTCLAYLFKFLWRPLTKDIHIVFKKLLPLLCDTRPTYINDFASESFAFVVRKVKDIERFLSLLVKAVAKNESEIEGCGKLLFEVINGVNGNFHSCADILLPFFLESLGNDSLPPNTMFRILERIVNNIVININIYQSDVYWNSCVNILEIFTNKWKLDQSGQHLECVEKCLQLMGKAVEYKSGKFLQNPILVVNKIIGLLPIIQQLESALLATVQLSIAILIGKNVKLAQEQSSTLTRQLLNVQNPKLFLYFVENSTTYSSFEALIFPTYLKYCVNCKMDEQSLLVLSQIIQKKSSLCGSGIDLNGWRKYTIDFGSIQSNLEMQQVLLNYIANGVFEKSNLHLDNYLCALICAAHLKIENQEHWQRILNEKINLLWDAASQAYENSENDYLKKLLYTLLNTMECAIHVCENALPKDHWDMIYTCIVPMCTHISLLGALKVLDLYLTACKDVICLDVLNSLHSTLIVNFNSPYHEVRLLTAHIYSLFEGADGLHSDWKLFSLCYEIESIPAQVHTYREQVIRIEKLNFEKPEVGVAKNTNFDTIPLRYLCGILFNNFKLLWDSVIPVIASHAYGLDIGNFWSFFLTELKTATNVARNPTTREYFQLGTNVAFLEDHYLKVYETESKPDYFNYRLLLWKAMESFSDIVEMKNRDISEMFFEFMENEYSKNSVAGAKTYNIKQNIEPAGVIAEISDIEEDTENHEREPRPKIVAKLNKEFTGHVGAKANLNYLLQQLRVFSKIRSPLSVYRQSELYNLYLKFLLHRNTDVQKLALNCILAYKQKFLLPYKGNLLNLIDEKNFKNELALFRIDQESDIPATDRDALLPLVLRLAFSKMFTKTGMTTGGKSSGQFRRKLVLRFLTGCKEQELLNFTDMAFGFYKTYINFNDNPELMQQQIAEGVDFEQFPSLKRFQSTLNLLTVFKQLGGFLGNKILSQFIKIIVVIGAHVKEALTRNSEIHAGYFNSLKHIRSSAITILASLFGTFDNYPWTSEEINVIFKVFVWPYVDKLPIEGIHSPTALFKLFGVWGSNPRYFLLLVKYNREYADCVLPKVVQLMLQTQTNVLVYNAIMEMFENMLRLNENAEEEHLKLDVSGIRPIEESILKKLKTNDKLNFGSCILLPHAPDILRKLKMKLESKSKTLDQRELFILSRISELVWEPAICDSVLEILIPVILKKSTSGEEVLAKYLTTVKNLVQNVEKPQKHIPSLLPCFGSVLHVSCRKLLIEIVNIIADVEKGNSDMISMARLLLDLNAFDAKWVDQPYFEKRLSAFKEINELSANSKINLNLGIAVIYNCSFTICHETDLSLRESASNCWKLVASNLMVNNVKTSDQDWILNRTLFSLIRKGMRSRAENFRNECILLLGHLARKHAANHVVLTDLHKLTNEVDVEVDFFENITHMQLHRHGRAILKFSNIFSDQSANTRSFTQFILPLLSHYLCNEKYASKSSLIDAVTGGFDTIMRRLPWHQYEGVLKYYLSALQRKIDYQKQLVRLVIVILDAFHFNLSKAEACDVELQNTTTEPTNTDDVQNESAVDDLMAPLEQEDDEEEEEGIRDLTDNNKIKEDDSMMLCKSTAARVIRTIQMTLIPQLNRVLAEMTQFDAAHKVNKKKMAFERVEVDLLRVPISLAMVKLLQQLPKKLLDTHLPRILLKLCTFLKSQLESVRRTARETLQKIMASLGAEYLPILLEVMASLLSKGYQVHVLVYTTHAILVSLKGKFEEGHIDKVLTTVLNLCKVDLFGYLGEEKEVDKITRKIVEAKSTKSYDTFRILAEYVTHKCLVDLILPIKEVVIATRSHKIIVKAQEALRNISIGLIENSFVSVEVLLQFAYGICSEKILELLPKESASEKGIADRTNQKSDCFIIPPLPVNRSGFRQSIVKVSGDTNSYLLVEFGLQLCHHLFKKEKLREESFIKLVDPFLPILKNCLDTKHVKLTTLTLNCLSWIVKFKLPSLKLHIKEISESVFNILHKYAAAGLSKGDNFDLVVAAFKTMTVLVREVNCFKVNNDKLKVLLLYVEQDLHDYNRQATAFNLLKAIIARKLRVNEIHPIMGKIAEMSITSELPHIRMQCRLVFYQFIMEYPLGKRLPRLISFYLSQLNYEVQTGRESALEMVQSLITGFPSDVLKDQSELFLVALGARLVNDDVPECKKMVAKCLTSMFTTLKKEDRNPLFDIILIWLKDDDVNHKRLAAQLCGILVAVEKSSFESRLRYLMPIILDEFGIAESRTNGRYVLLKFTEISEENNTSERLKDHHMFQILQLLLKLCAYCPAFLGRISEIQSLAEHVQTLLTHPHEWLRLASVQFLGFVLSSLKVDHLAELLVSNKSEKQGYLHTDPANQIKSLTLDLCAQLQSGIKMDFAEQIMKNLLFVAHVLEAVPLESSDNKDLKINLLWMAKRMRKIVNMEVVENPSESVLRTVVFQWIAAVGTTLNCDKIIQILPHLLGPLVREMLSQEIANAPLRQLSKEVGNMIKNRVGVETYTKILSKQQQNLAVRRAVRKRERVELAVKDPELYAKKKIKQHEKKKIAKKRKIDDRKGGSRVMVKKQRNIDLDVSEIV